MSGPGANAFYTTLRSPGQELIDLIFPFQANIPTTLGPQNFAVVPLTSATTPDINTTPGGLAAYLVLRYLMVGSFQPPKDAQGNWEAYAAAPSTLSFNPGTGQFQTVIFGKQTGGTRLLSYNISSQGANLTVTNVEVKRDIEPPTAYRSVIPFGTTITAGGNFTLGAVFSPQYGYQTFESTANIAIRLTVTNTGGAAQTLIFSPVGEVWAQDSYKFEIQYAEPGSDPVAGSFTIATAVPTTGGFYRLNALINRALMDPGGQGYGSLFIALDEFSQFYDTTVTISGLLLASLVYLLPVRG